MPSPAPPGSWSGAPCPKDMKGPAGAIALQSQNRRPLMEIGIVLDGFGVADARNGIFKENTIRCQFL